MQSYARPVITGRYTSPAVSRYACMIIAVSVAWHAAWLCEPAVTHLLVPSPPPVPAPVITRTAHCISMPGLIVKIALEIRRRGTDTSRGSGGEHSAMRVQYAVLICIAGRFCELMFNAVKPDARGVRTKIPHERRIMFFFFLCFSPYFGDINGCTFAHCCSILNKSRYHLSVLYL